MAQYEEMTFIEAVRKRPAMYAGSTSIRGFNNLLRALIKDVFEATNADYFSFEFLGDFRGKLIFKNLQTVISDNIALNFWRLYENNWQGFEFAALNALSKHFEIKVFDKGEVELFQQTFEKGELKHGELKNQKYKAETFEITFDLDDSIFEVSEPLNADYYLEEIRGIAYLHKGKSFSLIYTIANEECKAVFNFKNGLKDKIEVVKLKGFCGTYLDTYIEETFENFTFEAAFCFRETPVDESFLISYANYIHTHENGSHVNAFLKGIRQAAAQYVSSKQLKDVEITSNEAIIETLVAAIHIKMDKPHFEGAVKNKLINPEIVSPIAEYMSEVMLQKMESDEKSAESLLNVFSRYNWSNTK